MSSSLISSAQDTTTSVPWYYSFFIRLLKPLYRIKVWHRSRHQENYHDEVNQRFGHSYPARPQFEGMQGVIWCHAVSLGETNTIAPLLDELMTKGYAIWLTNTTETGFTRVEKRFVAAIEEGQLVHSYVPVDDNKVMQTFIDHVQPVAALFVETELWATTLAQLRQRQIPSILVNARLSEKSFINYQKFATISRSMMQNISLIIAQDGDSAKRFRQLGAASSKLRVAKSLKWSSSQVDGKRISLTPPEDYEMWCSTEIKQRPIWVAASTHEAEESAVIAAHKQIIQMAGLENTLLIIVPRHPERFDSVAQLLTQSGLSVAERSKQEAVTQKTQVYLADTMGELLYWYKLADVALVGGSLVKVGGHNPIEPASVATPVVMGCYCQTCQALLNALIKVEAAKQVGDDKDITRLVTALKPWLQDKQAAQEAGERAKALVDEQKDAMVQQLAMIERLLEPSNLIK